MTLKDDEYAIFEEKVVMAMRSMRHGTPSTISLMARKVDVTFAHASDITNLLEKHRVVETHISGRTRVVKLTGKGAKIHNALKKTYLLFNNGR